MQTKLNSGRDLKAVQSFVPLDIYTLVMSISMVVPILRLLDCFAFFLCKKDPGAGLALKIEKKIVKNVRQMTRVNGKSLEPRRLNDITCHSSQT